jgi:dTDP-4-dehydrorhamnose reductase
MAAEGRPLRVVADEIGNPTWAPDLARGILAAWQAGQGGVLHLAGEPPVSRFDWAAAILAGLPGLELEPIRSDAYPRPAPVPARAVLDLTLARGLGIGPLDWRGPSAAYAADLLAVA